jgi:cytochrome c peroxidase
MTNRADRQVVVSRRGRGREKWAAGVWAALVAAGGLGAVLLAEMPPVPVPVENPITEPKRILGKILFWDEQLSVTNSVSCGTCHQPSAGGTDPRVAINPGPDGVAGNDDDRRGSPGVRRSNADLEFLRDPIFGTKKQVTGRAANPAIGAQFAPALFWDGRAKSQFIDPQTGQVAIASGGALESQAVGPPVSNVEMGHDGLNWNILSAKIAGAKPLQLASNIPPDVAAALAGNPDYPELFRRAFGDTAVTAKRIAFAIATYERTLVPDQTPWDRFMAGDSSAMTPQQVAGWEALQAANCTACHTPPLFGNTSFRNIGVRPIEEDIGRQAVTGQPFDAGRFKTPTLRNAGLKKTFMHGGQFTSMLEVLGFYFGAFGFFGDNIDPLMDGVVFPDGSVDPMLDFLNNAMTDPRVASESFPFDRPTLATERPGAFASEPTGPGSAGIAGAGGAVPKLVADSPAAVGLLGFRVGIDGALGGARCRLVMSTTPPTGATISQDRAVAETFAPGTGPGAGLASIYVLLTGDRFAPGQTVYMQWLVDDPAAVGGVAATPVAAFTPFCGRTGCAPACPTDYNVDGFSNLDDLGDFITDYYTVPAIPGGLRADAPTAQSIDLGFGRPCPDAPDAPAPYAPDSYRVFGYRVGFSPDGSNACPLSPAQPFPNLDNLGDFITAYYAGGC